MTPTKEQQAQEYAENVQFPFGISEGMVDFITYIAKFAWLDGYTAREQSMWRSVEEELPEKYKVVLVWIPSAKFSDAQYTGAYYDGEDWIIHYGTEVRLAKPTHWRELPSLPDKNTKKNG